MPSSAMLRVYLLLSIVLIASGDQIPGLDAVVPEDPIAVPPATVSPEIGQTQVPEKLAPKAKASAATAKKVVALLKKMLKKKQAAMRAQQAAAKAQQAKLQQQRLAQQRAAQRAQLKAKQARAAKLAKEKAAKKPKLVHLKHGSDLLHKMAHSTLSSAVQRDQAMHDAEIAQEKNFKLSVKNVEVRGKVAKKADQQDQIQAGIEMVADQEEHELTIKAKAKAKAKAEVDEREKEKEEEELAEEEEEEDEQLSMNALAQGEEVEVDLTAPAKMTTKAKAVLANLMKVSHDSKKKKAQKTAEKKQAAKKKAAMKKAVKLDEIATLKAKIAKLEAAKVVKPKKEKTLEKKKVEKKAVALKEEQEEEEPIPHGQVLLRGPSATTASKDPTPSAKKAKKAAATEKPATEKMMSALERAFSRDLSSEEVPPSTEMEDITHDPVVVESRLRVEQEKQYAAKVERSIASERSHKAEKRRQHRQELAQLRLKLLSPPVVVAPPKKAAVHQDAVSPAVVATRAKLSKDLGTQKSRGKAFKKSIAKHYRQDENATAEQIAGSLMKTLDGHALDDQTLEAKVQKMLSSHQKATPKAEPKAKETAAVAKPKAKPPQQTAAVAKKKEAKKPERAAPMVLTWYSKAMASDLEQADEAYEAAAP